MVKNEVMRHDDLTKRLFRMVYPVNNNINLNKILHVVLSICLQLECKDLIGESEAAPLLLISPVN